MCLIKNFHLLKRWWEVRWEERWEKRWEVRWEKRWEKGWEKGWKKRWKKRWEIWWKEWWEEWRKIWWKERANYRIIYSSPDGNNRSISYSCGNCVKKWVARNTSWYAGHIANDETCTSYCCVSICFRCSDLLE